MDAFQGVQWANVRELLRIVLESKLPLRQNIARRYREQATNLSRTVAFLRGIRVLHEKNGRISVSRDFQKVVASGDERTMQLHLLDHVLQSRTRFRKEVCDYLRRFEVIAGEVVYRPDSRTRGRKSFVRNFLIELGIIVYSGESDLYLLSPDHLDLYVTLRDRHRCSPSVLQRRVRACESIGWAAEEFVFVYERERVGADFEHLVDHVSARNVAAGYDIKSITLTDRGTTLPRYIEVKAVSDVSLTFYWTSNEIRIAELLGDDYYLYLVPITRQGQFCRERLRVVRNAHMAVLGPNTEWQTCEDVIRCSFQGESLDRL